ncbi:MAG: AAA domain-containing protein [Candidatus Gracilibacteria bacterium]|jgi:superfamily I DNA and/or RNA helicase
MVTKEEHCIQEMLLALEANIEYLRREGNSQIKITNGQLLKNVGDIFLYEFTLDFFSNLEPNADIEVRIENENASGKVVLIEEKKIQLELEKNIGVVIGEAKLVVSNYYLLQLLKDKLDKVQKGEIKLSNFSQKTFGLISSITAVDNNYQIPTSVSFSANDSQEEAIRLAVGSEVSFIWGPPGTGKTETIARIIEAFLSKNLSVLLIAHTNVATDGALLDVVKHLETTADYNEGRILREGNIQKEELREYERVIPAIALERKGEGIMKELTTLAKKIEKISSILESVKKIISQAERLVKVRKDEENILAEIKNVKEIIRRAEVVAYKYKNDLSTVEEKIKKSQTIGTVSRIFYGLSIKSLIKQKSALLIEIEKESNKINTNNKSLREGEERIANLVKERQNLEITCEGISLNDCKNEVRKSEHELDRLHEQHALLQQQLQEMGENMIREAKVIATTLTKSYSSKVVLSREYDCIILDEASMAPLPALWFAGGLAKQKVVIVGDFYQLPPIAKHKIIETGKDSAKIEEEKTLIKKWLKRDVFAFVGIESNIKSGSVPVNLKQLKVQYRMHPDIAGVINKLVYGKSGKQFELESDESTKKKDKLLNKPPLEKFHVGIYNTHTAGAIANRTDSGSIYNIYNALLAVNLAKEALESGYKNIGIISPFRSQANLIQKILKDEKLDDAGQVVADTVHRFQGGEKELIIFDVTTPVRTKLTDSENEDGDDIKLLNVAFSRAKEKCLVIADVENIEQKHSNSSLVKKFIEYCHQHGFPVISSDSHVSKYSVIDKTEKWLKKINNLEDVSRQIESSKLFDESDFYHNFLLDLFSAQKEVVIDSPFITSDRARTFKPIFDHLISKGLKIFILTRRPEEHGALMRSQAESEIKEFEQMGVVVLQFTGHIHRKLAVIDRKILWSGSLNILSQKNSHEIMHRFVGEATAQQMVNFLRLDKNLGLLGENKLKKCENCKQPGAWYWTDRGRYGTWTRCLACGEKPGKSFQSKSAGQQVNVANGIPLCPKCNLPMKKRLGRFGEFWGCIKYPTCKETVKFK